MPDITNRSYSITADVDIPASGAEGVLLAVGGRIGGYVLYVKDRHLVYEYAYREDARYVIRSDAQVPTGQSTLRFEFTKTGQHRGMGTLFVDGQRAGSGDLPKTWPLTGISSGLLCGRDGGSPVSDDYASPFPFTATIRRVVVQLGDDPQRDPAAEDKAALAEE